MIHRLMQMSGGGWGGAGSAPQTQEPAGGHACERFGTSTASALGASSLAAPGAGGESPSEPPPPRGTEQQVPRAAARTGR